MLVKVRIPTPLRPLAGGQEEVPAEGNTLAEVIRNLQNRYNGLGPRLCDASGQVRRFINLYVNDQDSRSLAGLETSLKEGDTISIIPAIAGGRER